MERIKFYYELHAAFKKKVANVSKGVKINFNIFKFNSKKPFNFILDENIILSNIICIYLGGLEAERTQKIKIRFLKIKYLAPVFTSYYQCRLWVVKTLPLD